ncbi:MAG: potassium-transporting ATPase subunit KdpA [Verrucomicrobiota bacterium]|nr:potassium-transporting ATPase subunit KdpA [Verrucomicrobiota bacterium]
MVEVLDLIQLGLFLAIILLLTKPVGLYFKKVLNQSDHTFLDRVLKPVERTIYRLCKIEGEEQDWKEYLACILGFSIVSVLFTVLLLSLQYYLPFNPQKLAALSWDLNLHTSVSFMTNTNWQNYSGESTMSYFSQMAALAVQNFASAAVGIAAAAALVRGIARKQKKTLGNFWVDVVRITLYFLLPVSILASAFFLWEGVPQNLNAYVQAETLEGAIQTLPQGPIASQEAIKLLGTNGGGFFNANSSHPYENPTPLSNFLQYILIFLISASLIYYYGKTIGDTKHSWCILVSLLGVYVVGVLLCAYFEVHGNPELLKMGLTGGNWEGKEQRFGLFSSALFACTTTVTSCGAVNCMHDSFIPLGGFIPLLNMQLSETIIGGVGAGLYSVLVFILLSIFIAGLIIGRTPEYLGKKIEAFDIKMILLANLSYVLLVLIFTSWACVSAWGLKGLGNSGPHGFTEILYAYSSCAANNGSAFAGLSGNTIPYNVTMTIAMFLGRFLFMAPVIALAGSFVEKKIHPQSAGSFPVASVVFISLLLGVILLLGALNFLPALTLGPIVEQFFLLRGELF